MPPVRDRSTRVIYGALAAYGYGLYGLGPALDALRDELEVSRAAIGLAGSAFALGAVVSALGSPAALARRGLRTVLAASLAVFGAGTILLVAAPALAVVIAAAFVLGITGTAILVTVPLVIDERQGDARAAALAEANMCAAGAGVVAPALIGLSVALGAGWRPGVVVVVVALAALAVAARTVAVPPPPRPAGPLPATTRLPRPFWRWWMVIVLVVGVEFSIVFWSTDLLQERTGMGQGAASAALGLFVGGITIGRFAGGRLAIDREPRGLIAVSLAVAAAGFVLLWGTTSPAVSMAGLFVSGLGVALLFPMTLALAMAAAPHAAALASARASLAGALAILIAPYALATVADAVGVRAGFLIVPALIAGATVLILGARGPGEPVAAGAAAGP